MNPRPHPRLLTACLAFGSFLLPFIAAPSPAAADELKNDARLEGYKGRPVALDAGTAPYTLLFGALCLVGASGLFMDAKRSHLD